MFAYSISRLPSVLVILAALAAMELRGAPLSVTDLKGRSIEIEMLSLAGDSVTFRRPGGPKEFTLPVITFDQASQDLIRKQGSLLPAPAPKIQADVVLGKRRRDKGDSYYMVKQEITSTVKLSNLNTSAPVSGLTGRLIYIGQNTRTPDLYTVLSNQKFEASINPNDTFVKEMEAFSTSYDSDNKGTNNVGGFQYFGYILVLMDGPGNVVLTQTTTGSFRLAIAAKPQLAKDILTYAAGKAITDKLESSPGSAGLRVPK